MLSLTSIESTLIKHYGLKDLQLKATPQSGGDIHKSYVLNLHTSEETNNKPIPDQLFAKTNSGQGTQVLESEFQSLNLINSICPSLYPQAILFDRFDDGGFLLMSYHPLTTLSPTNAADAGRALALQHKHSHENFGWSCDNYIGLTPQSNTWTKNWVTFFREQRLLPMTKLAKKQGLAAPLLAKVERVTEDLDALLSHEVVPSLVHGDLWSGNLGFDQAANQPLFYDPAPYYGDREVDLAMTELFGRQPESFYAAYKEEWTLASGYPQRRGVYNLYHALNHVVLFGSSYNGLVENCLSQIYGL